MNLKQLQFPEAGYTPDNLRYIMSVSRVSSAQIAKLMNVHPTTVVRWRTDPMSGMKL